ncbi:neuronal acetylcholine receptor subunit beta-4 [Biomphalaria glabrata]
MACLMVVSVLVCSCVYVMCLTNDSDWREPLTSWRRNKARLKEDLRSRREALGKTNPADDATNRFIHLTIQFSPTSVIQVDEVKQTLITICSLYIIWTDAELAWNASEYGNINVITENLDSIWHPTIQLYNSADVNNLVVKNLLDYVFVASNGQVTLFTTAGLETFCEIDLTSYPFDEQICHITFFPFPEDFNYTITPVKMSLEPIDMHGEWIIVERHLEMTSHVSLNGYSVAKLKVTLKLRRSTIYYIFSIVVPLALISIMTPIVFWIPPSSGERLSYLVSMFISTTVYLSYLVSSMPKSLTRTPRLLIVLIVVMGQTFASIIATIIVMKKHAKEQVRQKELSSGKTSCQALPDFNEKESLENENQSDNKAKEDSDTKTMTSVQLDAMFFFGYYLICIPVYFLICYI